MTGYLTEHFHVDEFRCRCGCGIIMVSFDLLTALEDLRTLGGDRGVMISDGCRCPRRNRRCGGTDNSQHLTTETPVRPCKAADVVLPGRSVRQMFSDARQVPAFLNGGIGVYPEEGFVHVDVRGTKARWARLKRRGPYTSIPKGFWTT